MGEVPTVCLNLRAKVDRDMPARSPNSCIVQRCAGSLLTRKSQGASDTKAVSATVNRADGPIQRELENA